MSKKRAATKTAIEHTVNPQSQPWFELIQTTKVTPNIAPVVTLNKNQLKKLASDSASLGSLSSNWSAPKEGRAPLIPLLPNAIKYRPVNNIAS